MEQTKEARTARKGRILPYVKALPAVGDALPLFAGLSGRGKAENSLLLESADIIKKYGEQSLGTAQPCLRVHGKGSEFSIEALNPLGVRFLEFMRSDLDFCDSVEYCKNAIKGTLEPKRGTVSEQERLLLKTHADVLRAVAFKFAPAERPFMPYAGLFGIIGYDFIDQFEDLPRNRKDLLKEPDYELYFVDNLFLINHREKAMSIVANALLCGGDDAAEKERCAAVIEGYEKAVGKARETDLEFKSSAAKPRKISTSTDTPKKEFLKMVGAAKRHILRGNVFQIVLSRTLVRECSAEPLSVYKELRNLNPSPYMFYINSPTGIMLGASPEMCISVRGSAEKRVEIKPIAGTKPRGLVNGMVDEELDSRYEAELKLDRKELAEHTMLVDLARNDVARVCIAGTRTVEQPFEVEKYSHVQHLVSRVVGTLKPELDCLHAYLASMNMGTLTGAPKVEAMKIIRGLEKTRRGFYGGAVVYITPSGELDSAIVIRSARLKAGKAYVRAGAGIVYDSVPESEFEETERKARACIRAIELAEGSD